MARPVEEMCYQEGYDAYFDWKSLSSNPYRKTNPDCADQWRDGWYDACDDDTDDVYSYDEDDWW